MAYTVEIELVAAIHPQYAQRIAKRIQMLAVDPRPRGCVKLAGVGDSWRIRVGDYRVVYVIEDAVKVVTVTRVGPRGSVYGR